MLFGMFLAFFSDVGRKKLLFDIFQKRVLFSLYFEHIFSLSVNFLCHLAYFE